jgi:hypothetical protein
MAMCGCGAGGQNEDEMRQNLVIYPLGFRLTDPVAGAHYPLADGPGARRSAVRTIMARAEPVSPPRATARCIDPPV